MSGQLESLHRGRKMNNYYYHAFTPGFNWWMIFALLTVVVMAVLGWRSASLQRIKKGKNKGKYRIVPRVSLNVFLFLGSVFTIVFVVMVLVESIHGIVQLLDNLSVESLPVWSIILVVCVIIIAVIIYVCLLCFAYTVSYDIKADLLCRREDSMISRKVR